MRQQWLTLNELDRAAFHAAIAFLRSRLEERATVDWALRLRPNDTIKRLALLEIIDSPTGSKIREPWRSAWRLIEESWHTFLVEDSAGIDAHHAQNRLRAGDRSRALVATIAGIVAPRLKIEPFSNLQLSYRKPPKRAKRVEDLFSMRLTSGDIVDPDVLKLENVSDRSFLLSLALALEAAVVNGLDIARRVGWDGEHSIWRLGQLHRVYYVPAGHRADEENEPDRFHRGIAPSVKLLHTVISRLVDIDVSIAIEFTRRWKVTNSPVHLRLWAALSRDSRVTPADELGVLLLSLDDRRFWNIQNYPEIAELRAKRFTELAPHEQAALTNRIRKLPPRNLWPRKADEQQVKQFRLYWAIRELRRIEISGASLQSGDKIWMDTRIDKFPDLLQMVRIDDGFMVSVKARFVPPNPDSRFDLLKGEERLKTLEADLSSVRSGWDDDPSARAADWIRKPGNSIQVLGDFESVPDAGATFPRVWEHFAWAHSPPREQSEHTREDSPPTECSRVLSLLTNLAESTVRQAIDGISYWLSIWEKQVVALPDGLAVWFRLWPVAVEVANAEQLIEEEDVLNKIAPISDDQEPADLDTLNTPVGKLVEVFLTACPTVRPGEAPFSEKNAQTKMRDAVETAIGTAGLIVKYRLIESLHYFLKADLQWTQVHLVAPLLEDTPDARVLWRAVGRQTRFFDELKIIGEAMADRATDWQLGRETRRSLVFSLVVECLHAFREQREPAVPNARITQMIRLLDDEVRAHGAGTVQRFVHEVSIPSEGEAASSSPANIFRTAAKPFLMKVWPQERSLATPGVSQALADLPATTKEAFAEAVDAIERFLVPFKCWSMLDYGLFGEADSQPKLSSIDNKVKATAFLKLLNLTIGTAEGSVIPYDLADALDQIRRVAPDLAEDQVFRRLATASRRG